MFPLDFFDNELKLRQEHGLLRSIPHKNKLPAHKYDSLHNFASNDYLGLSNHPELISGACQATQKWGTGSTGSRLISGSLDIFTETEDLLAEWKGFERALLFNNGYAANLGIISALATPGTQFFLDRLAHASIYDGAKLAQATMHRFKHNDLDDLRRLLTLHPGKSWIFVESVYSMDGDKAPLQELVKIAHEFSAGLVVDEAHADGIYGEKGQGLVHALGLHDQVDIIMGTMGKALGVAGACVWAAPTILDWLTNQARSFIYSTAQSPATLGAIQASLRVLEDEPWRREKLLSLSDFFRTQLNQYGFNTLQSSTQIIPIILGDNQSALSASQYLAMQGFWVPAIRQPTVPPGTARLRANITSLHAQECIAKLVQHLVQWRDTAKQGVL